MTAGVLCPNAVYAHRDRYSHNMYVWLADAHIGRDVVLVANILSGVRTPPSGHAREFRGSLEVCNHGNAVIRTVSPGRESGSYRAVVPTRSLAGGFYGSTGPGSDS